ncbi:MAG: CBS domain-containing protein [Anaerolineaceae bacterium]|jgi:CBS domain-containing protein|nr:MAG: CBS domain-containing protein [Anaerolineaceae bacterium]
MKTVSDILKSKGNAVYSITPNNTVLDALKIMAEKGIGAILVMEGGEVCGIFSERDYARRVILQRKTEATPIREVMTEDIYFVHPEQTVDECMAQMTDKHIRHLPVVEDEVVVGVISIGDLVKTITEDQADLIRNLEDYIMGRGYNH